MAITLSPETFRQLAEYAPARVQDAGGIVCPTLEIIADKACHSMGHDSGGAALVFLEDAPSGWIFFGDSVGGGPGEDYNRRILLSTGDSFYLNRKGPDSWLSLMPDGKTEDHAHLSSKVTTLLRRRALAWPKFAYRSQLSSGWG